MEDGVYVEDKGVAHVDLLFLIREWQLQWDHWKEFFCMLSVCP